MQNIDTIRFLGDLQRVSVEPGDTLVLKVPQPLPDDVCARLSERIESLFPGHKCIVLCDGLELGVISKMAA